MIDFLDGSLDPSIKSEVIRFLNENPDIKEEFNLISVNNSLSPEKIVFTGKDLLKKSFDDINEIHADNIDELIIAREEGDLSGEQTRRLGIFLDSHPEYKKEEQLVMKTYLKPENIGYPGKSSLKHFDLKFTLIRLGSAISIAASVLFAVWFFAGDPVLIDHKDRVATETTVKSTTLDNEQTPAIRKETPTPDNQDKSQKDESEKNSEQLPTRTAEPRPSPVKVIRPRVIIAQSTPERINLRPAEMKHPELLSSHAGIPATASMVSPQRISKENLVASESLPSGTIKKNNSPRYLTPDEYAMKQVEKQGEKLAESAEDLWFVIRKTVSKNFNLKLEKTDEGTLFALNAGPVEVYRYNSGKSGK